MEKSERLDELFKYFHSAAAIADPDAHPPADSGAQLSNDPVLNALAQLGACRLNCDRAFISLISNNTQYVVAEVTQQGSLFDANRQPNGGGLAVGVRALDLASAICATTIPLFTDETNSRCVATANMLADSARFIVNDLSLEPSYSHKACVTGFPHMRFYAAAAIRSSAGHVLGNVAVIDSRPHPGLDEAGQSIITEIAASVMRHLELLRIQTSHDGVLKLLNGLETFVRGEATPDNDSNSNSDSDSDRDTAAASQSPNSHPSDPDSPPLDPHSSPSSTDTKHFARPASRPSSKKDSGERPDAVSVSSPDEKNRLDDSRPSSVPNQHQDVLSRASRLICTAMHMDRVFFIKAPSATAPQNSRRQSSPNILADTISTNAQQSPSTTETDGEKVEHKAQTDDGISEELHTSLLTQYPRGSYFNFTNYPRPKAPDSDIKAALYDSMRSALPPAHSLIFLPLFGLDNKTSVRSMFAWSAEKRRILQQEDLNYFRLFTASIEAKFSQIETAIQSRAKSDFISSISHELRSPLHGILGNAELLTNTSLDSDQEDSIAMIQKSGGALLTTLDHILTYSKINTRTKTQDLSQNTDSSKESLAPDTDLSLVVEDSVDTLISGNHFRKISANTSKSQVGKSALGSHQASADLDHLKFGPLVNLSIDAAPSWSVVTEEAVWVRSVINILGNAMKYTESGLIDVKLQLASPPSRPISNGSTRIVQLIVSDTGRGMSPTYLQNHLYHAFSQENTTSDGLGLGLSIVKKLVDGLGGSIDIQSTIGKGTTVKISAPVGNSESADHKQRFIISHHRGKSISFVGKSHQRNSTPKLEKSTVSQESTIASLSSTLLLYCKQWYNMNINYSNGIEDSTASIVMVFENDLELLLQDPKCDLQAWRRRHPRYAMIVISTGSATGRKSGSSKTDGVFSVIPPFGPRRLASIIQHAFEYAEKHKDIATIPPSSPEEATSVEEEGKKSIPSTVEEPRPVTIQPMNDDPGGKYVLVVDDNEVNIKIVSRCLLKWKIEYDTASDGAEAVRKFQTSDRPFDYILMDISMPVMNGIVATRAIRELETIEQFKSRVSIIAMTGLGDEKTRQEAIASGMDMFLTKPIRLGQIKSLLGIS